jgi:beta-glucosidase
MTPELRSAPYRDASLSIERRVEDLLGRMTLDEKLAQLGGVWVTSIAEGGRLDEARAKERLSLGTGHVTRIAAATVLRPNEVASLTNEIQRFLVESTRLGIPAIVHEESTGGFTARDATCFPQAIGLASTWEPELIEEVGRVIREQMRAVGARHTLAPVLDVARDPRWGRTEETYGEDPYLAARLGVAYVRGVQGADLASGVIATGKHFVGYGAPEGGLNWAPANLSRRELLERFVPPFEAAIREAGLASIMNAYCEIDGIPCAASPELLDALLRDGLGFEGTVVADYFSVATLMSYHRIAADQSEAAARALEAGIDVELPALDCYGEPLRQALASGRAEADWVDRSVCRVLRQKLQLGLFERPYVDADAAASQFQTAAQRALARTVAQKSLVLLKNENGLLPLDRSLGTLAVIGPAADSDRLLQGDYHYPTHLEIMFGAIRETPESGTRSGEAERRELAPAQATGEKADLGECFPPMVRIVDGIRSSVSAGTRVLTAPGCGVSGDSTAGFDEAVALAREADVAIVAVGDRSGLSDGCTSGEFTDRAELGLPGVQQALVEAVVATGTPTVAVLVNGRPLALPWIAEHVPAVLEAWLPGEEAGSAIADVLFGAVSPGGRLPVTLPRAVGQVPLYYNHKPSGGRSQIRGTYADLSNAPLYPFGHGESYTSFEYGPLEPSATRLPTRGGVELSVEVRNVGPREGDEVVQLYVHDVVASVTRPLKQLAGFKRISLSPGAAQRVTFHLDASQLAFYDRAMQLVVEPGEVEVMIGASSEDIRAAGTLELTGERRVLTSAEVRPTRVDLAPTSVGARSTRSHQEPSS